MNDPWELLSTFLLQHDTEHDNFPALRLARGEARANVYEKYWILVGKILKANKYSADILGEN